MTGDWDDAEAVWFCEGLPESAWRRAVVLWEVPAIPFFGFPRVADRAAVLARGGAPTTDDLDGEPPGPETGRQKPWRNRLLLGRLLPR